MAAKHWLLRLVPQRRYAKFFTGVILFTLLYPAFSLGVSATLDDQTPAFFFSLVIAYIVPVFSYITEKAQEAMRELRPLLDLDQENFELTYNRLSAVSPWIIALQLAGGAIMGGIHYTSLQGSLANALGGLTSSINNLTSGAGTLLTWMVMTSVIYMLVQQAVIFARLGGRSVHATPFNVRSLAPFARVSISASLSTIGALALFPLIGLEGGIDLREILPGAIALIAPLVAMFLLPVWPLHSRLAASKQRNLVQVDRLVNQSLDANGFIDGDAPQTARLHLLLTYRRELETCATWPFDVSNFGRLALYMIIPPLTWVAAALIENLVDSML